MFSKLGGVVLSVIMLFSVVTVAIATSHENEDNFKVFVCKYVGTPGDDERLQTGQNPISVSINAIPGFSGGDPVGYEFADAQGRSLVIAIDSGQDEDDLVCPTDEVQETPAPTPKGTPAPTPVPTPSETPKVTPKPVVKRTVVVNVPDTAMSH